MAKTIIIGKNRIDDIPKISITYPDAELVVSSMDCVADKICMEMAFMSPEVKERNTVTIVAGARTNYGMCFSLRQDFEKCYQHVRLFTVDLGEEHNNKVYFFDGSPVIDGTFKNDFQKELPGWVENLYASRILIKLDLEPTEYPSEELVKFIRSHEIPEAMYFKQDNIVVVCDAIDPGSDFDNVYLKLNDLVAKRNVKFNYDYMVNTHGLHMAVFHDLADPEVLDELEATLENTAGITYKLIHVPISNFDSFFRILPTHLINKELFNEN